jgi:ribosomal protein S8E
MSKQKYPQTASRGDNSLGGASRSTVRKSYSHAKADARKERKRMQAEDRQAEYDALSTKAKLASIPVGGGNRQRKRLEALLALEKAPQAKPAPLTQGEKDAKLVANVQAAVKTAPKGGTGKKK